MKMAKLLVFSGAFDQASAGDTFWPPHLRVGSSAEYFLASVPPSLKDDEATLKPAAMAGPKARPAIPKPAQKRNCLGCIAVPSITLRASRHILGMAGKRFQWGRTPPWRLKAKL